LRLAGVTQILKKSNIIIWSKFQVTNRKMKKYEKEYLLKKEQEAQLEDPVERLQVNCTG